MANFESCLQLEYGSIKLDLYVDMSVGIGGDKWPAAEQFCSLISSNIWHSFFSNLLDGKSILELGSGNGLIGILVEKLHPTALITISDIGNHLPLIIHNLEVNRSNGNSHVVEFDWFKPPALGVYDVVFAFECVYNEELYQPLIDSLYISSNKDTTIFLGLTRLFAKPKFFRLLKKSFKYRMIPKESFPNRYWDENSDSDVGLFIVQRI